MLNFGQFRVQGFLWSDLGTWYLGAAVLAVILKWFGGEPQAPVRKWGGWLLGLVGLLTLVTSYHFVDLAWFSNWWSEESVEGGLTALLAVLALGVPVLLRRLRS